MRVLLKPAHSPTILRECLKSPDSVKFVDYVPHFSFQTAAVNPTPRTVSLELPGLFKHALSLDPRNPEYIKQLAINYIWLRRNRDSASMKRDSRTASWWFTYAILARDWTMAREVLSENSNEELYFSNAEALVSRSCLEIWLAQAQGAFHRTPSDFAATRDQLYRKVEHIPRMRVY